MASPLSKVNTWLNPFYTRELLGQAHEQFAQARSLTLPLFLTPSACRLFGKLSLQHNYEPLIHSCRHATAPSFAKTSEFLETVCAVIGKQLQFTKIECRVFLPGDYTLLIDDALPAKGYALYLDLTSLPEKAGGYTSFLNNSEEFVRLVPRKNTLFLIDQTGFRSFVKYLNHYAKPRVFLYGELQ